MSLFFGVPFQRLLVYLVIILLVVTFRPISNLTHSTPLKFMTVGQVKEDLLKYARENHDWPNPTPTYLDLWGIPYVVVLTKTGHLSYTIKGAGVDQEWGTEDDVWTAGGYGWSRRTAKGSSQNR